LCERCGREFARPSGLYNHIKRGVCNRVLQSMSTDGSKKIKITIRESAVPPPPQPPQPPPQHRTYEELLNHVTHLEEQLAQIREKSQVINNTTNNTTNNMINIIVPPAFLQLDSYQYISSHLPNVLHNALSKHPANFISYLIQETNCNPDLPLHNTIKITKKYNYGQVSDGHRYVYKSKKQIIEELIENKRQILQEYIDQKGDKYGEKILRRYQNYLDLLDDDKKVKKTLEDDIVCMLLNISTFIGSDEWTQKLLSDLNTCEEIDHDT